MSEEQQYTPHCGYCQQEKPFKLAITNRTAGEWVLVCEDCLDDMADTLNRQVQQGSFQHPVLDGFMSFVCQEYGGKSVEKNSPDEVFSNLDFGVKGEENEEGTKD